MTRSIWFKAILEKIFFLMVLGVGGMSMVLAQSDFFSVRCPQQHNLSNRYDVNGDGRVGTMDILLMINILKNGHGDQTEQCVDIDGNGRLETFDVLMGLRYLESPQALDSTNDDKQDPSDQSPISQPASVLETAPSSSLNKEVREIIFPTEAEVQSVVRNAQDKFNTRLTQGEVELLRIMDRHILNNIQVEYIRRLLRMDHAFLKGLYDFDFSSLDQFPDDMYGHIVFAEWEKREALYALGLKNLEQLPGPVLSQLVTSVGMTTEKLKALKAVDPVLLSRGVTTLTPAQIATVATLDPSIVKEFDYPLLRQLSSMGDRALILVEVFGSDLSSVSHQNREDLDSIAMSPFGKQKIELLGETLKIKDLADFKEEDWHYFKTKDYLHLKQGFLAIQTAFGENGVEVLTMLARVESLPRVMEAIWAGEPVVDLVIEAGGFLVDSYLPMVRRVSCYGNPSRLSTSLLLYIRRQTGKQKIVSSDLDTITQINIDGIPYTGFKSLEGIGELCNLSFIKINRTYLESIPWESIARLSKLKHLELSQNKITGSIPVFDDRPDLKSDLANLSLETIDLHQNNLSGPLPDWIILASLKKLDVHKNQFTGSLPRALGYFANKADLNVEQNNFSGDISFLNQKNGREIILCPFNGDNNRFTGLVGRAYNHAETHRCVANTLEVERVQGSSDNQKIFPFEVQNRGPNLVRIKGMVFDIVPSQGSSGIDWSGLRVTLKALNAPAAVTRRPSSEGEIQFGTIQTVLGFDYKMPFHLSIDTTQMSSEALPKSGFRFRLKSVTAYNTAWDGKSDPTSTFGQDHFVYADIQHLDPHRTTMTGYEDSCQGEVNARYLCGWEMHLKEKGGQVDFIMGPSPEVERFSGDVVPQEEFGQSNG